MRYDSDLVEVVRVLGNDASDSGAKLVVMTARFEFNIESNDGMERVIVCGSCRPE